MAAWGRWHGARWSGIVWSWFGRRTARRRLSRANYVYELAKEYNQFYHDCSILKEQDTAVRCFRQLLSETVADVIKRGMGLLGIEMPERM